MSQPPLCDDPELFTAPWAAAVCRELTASEIYRKAAATWEGAMGFELAQDGAHAPGRAVVLELWHGECQGAREASPEELATLPFLIQGSPAAWHAVLVAGTDPIFALMSGKLRLARGSLSALIPYARAAQELVAAARRAPASLPPGWPAGGGKPAGRRSSA